MIVRRVLQLGMSALTLMLGLALGGSAPISRLRARISGMRR